MHLLALFLIAAPAQPAVPPPAASTADTYPTTRGTMGVSFYLPGGGDSRLIGGSYFFANDLAARFDFGLNAPLHPSGPGTQNTTFSLGIGLRSYQLKHDRVAVFLGPVVALGQEFSPAVPADVAFFLRLGGGLGVEYFFTNHFSAGATFELTLKFANIAGPANNPIYTTVSTGSSSLAANIYF